MRIFHIAVFIAAMAHAVVAQTWQSVIVLLLVTATWAHFFEGLRQDKIREDKLKSDDGDARFDVLHSLLTKHTQELEAANEHIRDLESSVGTLEKKATEVSKVISTSTIAQAFRPRMKE